MAATYGGSQACSAGYVPGRVRSAATSSTNDDMHRHDYRHTGHGVYWIRIFGSHVYHPSQTVTVQGTALILLLVAVLHLKSISI